MVQPTRCRGYGMGKMTTSLWMRHQGAPRSRARLDLIPVQALDRIEERKIITSKVGIEKRHRGRQLVPQEVDRACRSAGRDQPGC